MTGLLWLAVLLPLLAGGAALLVPAAAAWLSLAGAALAFAATVALPWIGTSGWGLLADPLSVQMAMLTAFAALTGAWQRQPARAQALYPLLLAALLLALLADDFFAAWAGMAVAVLCLVVALRLGGAVAAARRFFLTGGAALALALLGTLLLSLAASPLLPSDAVRWSLLTEAAAQLHGPLLTLAYVALLLGYGTLAGLVPLHAGLIAAQSSNAAPLAGLLPVVALMPLLRARLLLVANPDALPPGPPLLALGLLSLLLSAAALRRRQHGEKFIAIACAGQIGVVAFAFGLGTGASIFAGLLHLTLLTLVRTGLIQVVTRVRQMKGGDQFGGLLEHHRALALTLAALLMALAGLPPFGLFSSLFLILLEAARQMPALAVLLGIGLAGSTAGITARAVALCRDPPTPDTAPAPPPAALLPAWLHLAIVIGLGLAMPPFVSAWLVGIAEALR